jgi:hypothetical protein
MDGSASKMANGMARSVTGAPSGFFEMTKRQERPAISIIKYKGHNVIWLKVICPNVNRSHYVTQKSSHLLN